MRSAWFTVRKMRPERSFRRWETDDRVRNRPRSRRSGSNFLGSLHVVPSEMLVQTIFRQNGLDGANENGQNTDEEYWTTVSNLK